MTLDTYIYLDAMIWETLHTDPAYFQAIFHMLSKVKELYQSLAELGLANETIASELGLKAIALAGSCEEVDQARTWLCKMNCNKLRSEH